jgi:hypothetical protein
MRLINFILAFTAVSLFSVLIYAQDAYAPWAELRQKLPDGVRISYENMKLNTPDKSMVQLPAYPGAKIVATSNESESIDDSQKPVLATITLVSSDAADNVIGFYKDLITDYPGWHWDANIKIFYKGNLQAALNRHDSYIQVTPIKSMEPDLKYVSSDVLSNASSKIVVCYNPSDVK